MKHVWRKSRSGEELRPGWANVFIPVVVYACSGCGVEVVVCDNGNDTIKRASKRCVRRGTVLADCEIQAVKNVMDQ